MTSFFRYVLCCLLVLASQVALSAEPAATPERSNRSSSAVVAPPPAPPTGTSFAMPPSVAGGTDAPLTLDGDHAVGSPTAPYVLIEFADYQCPFCADFYQKTFPYLKSNYLDPGTVRFYHKDFPLEKHPQSMPAATAAHCAAKQGDFWRMQQRLYDNQAKLGEPLYKDIAQELRLDMNKFAICRQDGSTRRLMLRDRTEGVAYGITATPTFILGRIVKGRLVVARVSTGAPTFREFEKEIDALVRATAANPEAILSGGGGSAVSR